jgi:hypothetical protein
MRSSFSACRGGLGKLLAFLAHPGALADDRQPVLGRLDDVADLVPVHAHAPDL